ncbi:hypothetical protein [Streptomyces sp. NPDC126514]|uniref:hypothetical protein n=1 Tax=Streptomyces sp. NPDC126514 TaxID=3155210 RepID=UPI0033190D98
MTTCILRIAGGLRLLRHCARGVRPGGTPREEVLGWAVDWARVVSMRERGHAWVGPDDVRLIAAEDFGLGVTAREAARALQGLPGPGPLRPPGLHAAD